MAVRVLIVDDHPSFRASARTLLELEGFEVVGEAADGASALELVGRLQPELVLLDIALPDTSGAQLPTQDQITKATDVISKGWPTTVNVTVK